MKEEDEHLLVHRQTEHGMYCLYKCMLVAKHKELEAAFTELSRITEMHKLEKERLNQKRKQAELEKLEQRVASKIKEAEAANAR